MNYSDIAVPAYMNLWQVAYFLPVAGLIFLAVIVAIASWRDQRKLGKRALVAIVSVTAATSVASLALLPAIQGFKDQQDRNFAAALQREYGATSSKTFSEVFGLAGDRVSVLTRDGKATKVRFLINDDDMITPISITTSEETYQKLGGK